jgi:hypothetical protein
MEIKMKIGLISFKYDSCGYNITMRYVDWLIEAMRNYGEQEGSLPDLVLSAGYTCMDAAGLFALEREFSDKQVSVAVELLNPADDPVTGPRHLKGCSQLHVVGRGGTLAIEPRQRFKSSGDVAEEKAEAVVAGLAPNGGRRFSVQSRQVGWIECGEVNLLCCGKDGESSAVRVRYEGLEHRFFDAVTSLDIILNPQHTRMSRLHLLRRKAEALSAGSIIHAPAGRRWPVYAGTANWNRTTGQRGSQASLQCVMRDGQRLSPTDIIETEDYILSVFTVDMPRRSH